MRRMPAELIDEMPTNESDFDRFERGEMGEAPAAPGREGTFLPQDQHGDTYGRRVVVNQGAASFVPGPWTGDHGVEKLWLIQFQQTNEQAIRGGIKVQVNYGVGGAKLQRNFTLPAPPSGAAANTVGPTPVYAVPIFARHVDVSLASATIAILQVGICPVPHFSRQEFYAWQSFEYNSAGRAGQIVTTPGVLRNARAVYQALVAGGAGVPVWPMLFDASAAPAGGSTPLVLLPALRQLGDDVSFEDSSPGTFQFASGLYVALSSTPDTYTDAGSGEIVVTGELGG